MLISIITASYNSEKTIGKTINSILNQSSSNFEYIIIDGNSKDNTLSIIEKHEKDFIKKGIRFKWVSEPDKGIYDAWNKGISYAKGNWIGFLGSDDVYYPDALEKYENILKSHPNIDYVSSKVRLVNKGKLLRIISGKWQWKIFKHYMNVAHVGSLHSANYYKKYGIYNTKYKIAGDYEMLLRSQDSLKYLFMDEFTAEMEAGGLSNSLVKQVMLETRLAKNKSGKVNIIIANMDFVIAFLKIKIKKILKFV
ncbi:glycosyltransferase family 2 protein [uncultured Algibacter sp.]|uniref:glycosyltransferase family 2 protein n=1 Tax=uncultured Algibacter sp. TaxID=298659 RepID=UPI0026338C22|nr:glycosyltransferase family 2 protein [uncultured Algibacter sp.]